VDALFDRVIERARLIARGAARGGGALLLAGAVIVSIDVLARKFLNLSLGGADELAGYAFAIGTAWSFAFVVLERGNVRVDALYIHLPATLAAALDLLALLALLAFISVVARYGWDLMAGSFDRGARSNSALAVPLWIPQALWWLGYAIFTLIVMLLIVRVAHALWRRDFTAVARLAGARSTAEEAQNEIENAQAAAGLADAAGRAR